MSTYRNLITLCAAAVLTLGVAACGGGSDAPATDGTDMMEPTPQEQIAALQKEINDLRAQLGLAADDNLSDSITALQDEVADLKQQIQDAADDEADRMAAEARATAAKLYAGISAPMGGLTDTAATTRAAAYDAAETGITVNIGDGTTANTADLAENKKATVDDNHGWAGKMYMDPAGGDSYEAVVYSNVGEPTMGGKFGQIGVTTPATGYVYGLSAAGQATIDTSATAAYVNLVGGSSFDQSAGVKRFPLPSPNPGQATVVTVSGTFHGVSGTYSCTPGAAVCAANVSGRGFQLGTVPSATDAQFTDGGGAWMFKPSNAEARVMSAPDADYASYGWWLMKTANGMTFTASAFTDEKGTVADASGLDALNGTATYMGGAAGKYALASSTGGTNDAGHFTARATLEANFSDNTAATAITGTLDMFMGADGMARDWEVELKGSAIGDTGVIGNSAATGGTAWTIDGTAAAASGSWAGALRNNGADGVPQVATGTFYTEYGTGGKMVGGFGANKQ